MFWLICRDNSGKNIFLYLDVSSFILDNELNLFIKSASPEAITVASTLNISSADTAALGSSILPFIEEIEELAARFNSSC